MYKDMTVQRLGEYWLENGIKPYLTESSYNSYRSRLNHIYPIIGDKVLTDLTKFDIQDMVFQLKKTELSNNSIRSIYNIFSQTIKFAEEIGLIVKNPNASIRTPNKEIYKPNIYSYFLIKRLISVTVGMDIHLPILLASLMGLRRGDG